MQSLVMTSTVMVAGFEDDGPQPSAVHVGRSVGGPLLNLLAGLAASLVFGLAGGGFVLLFFAVVNLAFAAFTLLPIPTLDGAVIWREVRGWTPRS